MWILVGIVAALAALAASSTGAAERVQVADPFLELRTGPGRGFPIFHIAERGEWVEIIKRRTDWFKVTTAKGRTGWVSRAQMERTLTEAGVETTFRDVLYEDYLRRRFEAGFSAGSMKGDGIARRDATLGGNFGYRFSDNQTIELAFNQISDSFFSGRFVSLGLVSQPFPHWTVSPTFRLGIGKGRIDPKTTLISAPDIDTELASAGIGGRMYFGRRFFLRFDYTTYRLFVDEADRTDRFDEVSAGIGFFF